MPTYDREREIGWRQRSLGDLWACRMVIFCSHPWDSYGIIMSNIPP